MTENDVNLEKLKREIVIERLRQAPPNINISFGSGEGKFMNRDELIKEVKSGTAIGEKIVKIQLEYLKAFKNKALV